jgi:hypothetical protein
MYICSVAGYVRGFSSNATGYVRQHLGHVTGGRVCEPQAEAGGDQSGFRPAAWYRGHLTGGITFCERCMCVM